MLRKKTDTVYLFLYVCAMVAISWLTDWVMIAVIFVAAISIFYRDSVQTLKKSLMLVGPFLLVTGIATFFYSRLILGVFGNWEIIAGLSLRAMLLAFVTFIFIKRVNLIEAVAFSKNLSIILAIAMAQILLYRRLAADFQMALRSRSARKPTTLGALQGASVITGSCLMLSIQHGHEVADALKSRGASHRV